MDEEIRYILREISRDLERIARALEKGNKQEKISVNKEFLQELVQKKRE